MIKRADICKSLLGFGFSDFFSVWVGFLGLWVFMGWVGSAKTEVKT
jgi:hypothetical protein